MESILSKSEGKAQSYQRPAEDHSVFHAAWSQQDPRALTVKDTSYLRNEVVIKKISSKRKSSACDTGERPSKRSRESPGCPEDHSVSLCVGSLENPGAVTCNLHSCNSEALGKKTDSKRKSSTCDAEERPRKRSRESPGCPEDHSVSLCVGSLENPGAVTCNLHSCNSEALGKKTDSKRKSSTCDAEERPPKRSRESPGCPEDHSVSLCVGSLENPGAVTCNLHSCNSEALGKKTDSKRKSSTCDAEERPRKRSRESPGCPEDHSVSLCVGSLENPGAVTCNLHSCNSEALGKKTDSKRKSSTCDAEERPCKRSRESPGCPEDHSVSLCVGSLENPGAATCNLHSCNSEASGKKTDSKRKSPTSETEEKPPNRSRESPVNAEDHSVSQAGGEKTGSEKCKEMVGPGETSGTSDQILIGPTYSSADFEAKYLEDRLLGQGGFGAVYAGYRRQDNLPVAIKRIHGEKVYYTAVLVDGNLKLVPHEVMLMLQLKPAGSETCAAVTLLDWFYLEKELILVLERPDPCIDMFHYLTNRKVVLQEDEAKAIAKQLVEAVVQIHSRGVVHRDIKMDNILLETGSDIPRVRLIDFGCGAFLSNEAYSTSQGTYIYSSPEWFTEGKYHAEPMTVWQLGITLFMALHGILPFSNSREIISQNLSISGELSSDCRDFILSCLNKDPKQRPTLEQLRSHPWLEPRGMFYHS